MTDFAQRVAKKLMERGYLAHWPFPTSIVTVVAQVIRRLLAEYASPDLDTLAREIAVLVGCRNDEQRPMCEVWEEVAERLAPYFAARDELANTVEIDDYDAGSLYDYGGGDVDWWRAYICAEITRCNEHWRSRVDAVVASRDEREAQVREKIEQTITLLQCYHGTEASEAMLREALALLPKAASDAG